VLAYLSASPHRPPGSPRRQLLGLGLLVLAVHAALLSGPLRWPAAALAPSLSRPAPQATHTVTLLARPARLAAAPGTEALPPPRAATPSPAPRQPRAPGPAAAAPQVAAAQPAPEPALPPDPPAGALPTPDLQGATQRSAPSLPSPRLPRAVTLDYRAQRGAHEGTANLDWTPAADGTYLLSLRLALAGRPESGWVSAGHTGPEGLAPDRMVEERRQRPVKAINFQRDKGLISFSSTPGTVALLPGAQDRISWLIQLSGLAQALDDRLDTGTTLTLQVATASGLAELWTFRVEESLGLRIEGQPEQAAWRLVREAQRPYDQRVEVWLARGNGLLPLQLRMTPVPSGEALLLTLRNPLGEMAGS
jgi:hypothetical protein